MAGAWRVLSGAVMLVVLLGLPVAPLWCELACPQEHAASSSAPVRESSPCHETAASAVAADDVAMTASTASGCDHPDVVSARPPDARALAPAPVAVGELTHLAPFAQAAAGRPAVRAVRGPAPPRGPTFTRVLRI
jgi:hypothetical protein